MSFTERAYIGLLGQATARYRFEPFGVPAPEPHVLWRHDIDISPQRAAHIAAIEAAYGVRATYFVHLHSPFYNALESPVRDALRSIVERRHHIGLHFEAGWYPVRSVRDLERQLVSEQRILERLLGVRIRAFAFHNIGGETRFDAASYAGLVNAYGRDLRERYQYVSDSNGYWRYRALGDVLAEAPARLHVLTHPEWWTPEAMPPRERVQRAITGRAVATARGYDEALAAGGRENVA